MMLSEIALECIDYMIEYMPTILHCCVLSLDHGDENVVVPCKVLLYNLV
jgi:hypothetical protein